MAEVFNCAYSDLVDLHKIVPNPKNPNKHDKKQIDLLAKLIDFQGQRLPLIVSNRSGFLVAGHGRLEAIQKLGWTKSAVDYQDFESEAQEIAFLISDNKIQELAESDESMIQDLAKSLGDFDFDLLGIPDFQLIETETLPQGDPDAVPEMPSEAKTKLGDVYRLGKHRLMCGDSTSVDAVEKLFDGGRADITFTSPPYNAGKNIRGNFYENDSDDKSENEYTDFLNAFTNTSLSFTDFAFVNIQILESNKRSIVQYQAAQIDRLKDILVWNKRQFPPHINAGTFGCKWEYVFAFGQYGKGRAFPCKWQGKFANVIETESNSGNEFADIHRAGFPVAFPGWIIEKMDFAKSVFDPFMGTGTTLIAAEKHGWHSFGMELDPKYCDVIVKRWEDFTGKKAELIQSKEG